MFSWLRKRWSKFLKPTYFFIHSDDERLILEKISKHKLYLPKGLMCSLIKEASSTHPGKTHSVFLLDDDLVVGVGVIIPFDRGYKGAIYVNNQVRGKGYGRALLETLLIISGDQTTYFYPWDNKSFKFFLGAVDSKILTLDNFEGVEKKIIELRKFTYAI